MTAHYKMTLAICVGCFGMTVRAETPDFLAETLKSDGLGYVDTGYKYKAAAYPKTTRVTMNLYSADWGRGTPPGPVTEEKSPYFFGEDGTCKLGFNGGNKGNVIFNGANHYVRTTEDVVGNNAIELDFVNGSYDWGSTHSDAFIPPTDDGAYTWLIFAARKKNEIQNKSVIDFKSLCFYETASEGAEETLVHDYVPCFANGKAALYDRSVQEILYPTSDGFTLSGYDIETAAGRPLVVNAVDSAPRNLTLAADSELVFDGRATLQPSDSVTLPAAGSVVVSLAGLSGRGRYVLIDGLSADYDLAAFRIGTVPEWCAGVLSKEGTKLVLTLSSDTSGMPDALADTLTSDAHGYIDTGYKFKATSSPKTARVEFDFHTETYGKGSAPGPVSDISTPALFGYYSDAAGDKYNVRYNGNNGQVIYAGEPSYQYVRSGQNGDVSIVADFLDETFTWGETKLTEVYAPTADSAYSFYFFTRNNAGIPENRSVIDFKAMRIYETNAQDAVSLVHEFVPCVNNGSPAVYDRVTETFCYPLASTNGFTAANVRWRLASNGETSFTSGDVALTGPADAAGWLAVRDRDGVVMARGTGTTAAFAMPEAAVSVRWTSDAEKSDAVRIEQNEYANVLTLSEGTALTFAGDSSITLSQGLTLPASGVIPVSVEGRMASGAYVLVDGLSAGTTLARFELASVPTDFTGALEIHGNRLVVRLTGESSALTALPDALAGSLKSDGVGYIDTGYKFKVTTYPRTARMEFAFQTSDYGVGTAPGPMSDDNSPALLGVGNGTWLTFRYNGHNKGEVQDCGGVSGSGHYIKGAGVIGDTTITFNFLSKSGTWGATSYEGAILPSTDCAYPCYVFGRNNGGIQSRSVYDFKRLKFYEQDQGGAETLAHDYVPCVKDGALGLYDQATQEYLYPTGDTNGFTAAGLTWPMETYSQIHQEFSRLSTISWRPVRVPAFAAEGEYAFVADGGLTLRSAVESLTIERYGANGSIVSSETAFDLPAGTVREVKLNDAVKAVVKVVGTVPAEPIVQDLGIAEVAGVTETLVRQTAKRRYEFLVTGDVTFTAKTGLCEAFADSYDAADELIGTTKVADSVVEGGSFVVKKGDAAKVIVRVTLTPPGHILFVR